VIDPLFRDGLLPNGNGDEILKCWHGLDSLIERVDELTGFNFLEIRSALPDELLMYTDKISMHHSLEGRVPYLDHEVIEFVERLPAAFKVRSGGQKWLHRRVCSRLLPKEVVHRRKRGFASTVVDKWFRSSLFAMMIGVFLDDRSLMYAYLNPEPVRRLYHDHTHKVSNNYKILFSLVLFEQWLREYTN